MKKALLPLALCVIISVHSYQQTVTTGETIISQSATPKKSVSEKNSANKSKRIYLQKIANNTTGADGCAGFKYNRGDTIVLTAAQNPYSWVTFNCINDVTIINEGGQVVLNWFDNGAIPGGFLFSNCKNIHLTGTGTPGVKYGFLITTPANRGVGVDVYERSSNFEIDHLNMYNKASGFWIKQEGDCNSNLSFPNWVLHDFKIHDNYIHNCSLEGMYLGSTDPDGTRGILCNGKTTYPKPMRLGNFRIYNNIIDSTGRGAIQLSDADSGKNEIYNNTITNIGFEFNAYQGNGIILGSYTHAYVHDNFIDNTYTAGIFSLGTGMVRIINNTVNHSGMLAGKTVSVMASILIDTRNSSNSSPGKPKPMKLTFKVKDNKLGTNTDYNIRVYNTFLTFATDNAICNNTKISGGAATHYVATGIFWKNECDTGLLNTKNYVEHHATAESLKTLNNSVHIFPNPANDFINVQLDEKIIGKTSLNIYNDQGRLLQTKSIYKNISQTQEAFNIKTLSAGLYTLQIITATGKTYFKFIKG